MPDLSLPRDTVVATPAAAAAVKTLLMLAFHFPPHGQSTGRLRTLSFVRHLPAQGWRPVVITARDSAYQQVDPRTLAEIPPGTTVIRAWGFDIARALSVKGVYPRRLATPDHWSPWALGAYRAGRAAIERHRPQFLWATFPIPSALLAAYALHRRTGVPFIADLRDPLVYESWPEIEWDRRVYTWLEHKIVAAARTVVVTTPGACAMYRERYPGVDPSRFQVIANGVDDEAVFNTAPGSAADAEAGPVTLIHSGLMESPDRDPTAFFKALRLLADQNKLPARGVRVILRASGREQVYGNAATNAGVAPMIEFLPPVSRNEAVKEQAAATGLLLFQGPECNRQIPAKAYEYLALRKPIIGLMHPAGDTHALVAREWQVPYAADMNTPDLIAQALAKFFADLAHGKAYVPADTLQPLYARRARAADLARLLDSHLRTDA